MWGELEFESAAQQRVMQPNVYEDIACLCYHHRESVVEQREKVPNILDNEIIATDTEYQQEADVVCLFNTSLS